MYLHFIPAMKHKLWAIVLCILVLVNTTFAQHKKTMLLDKIDTICADAKVDVNVRANNFNNITSFQGTIGWDSTVIRFDSLMYGVNTGSINLNDTTTSIIPSESNVSFIWNDSLPQSIPDNTILFILKFTIIKAKGNRTPVYFITNPSISNSAPEIDIMDIVNKKISASTDTAFIDGYIGFADTPKIIQNDYVLTCKASCIPAGYLWFVNGNPINNDTFRTISITGNGLYTVAVLYSNGNKVFSKPTNIVLPIEIISFNADIVKNGISLNWIAANENTTDYYDIGRKVNDGTYKTITTINAKGNALESEYSYNDNESVKGLINYQIQIVDKDGNKHYSKIVTVNKKVENTYTIYPDPAHNKINVEGENICELDVTDIAGKIMERKRFSVLSGKSNVVRVITIPNIAKGAYLLKIINMDGTNKVEKFMVDK